MAPPPGENQAAPQPRQNIAKDGDLILVVGPKRVEIRVDSHILRAASKTFRAMFGPHFAEGQNLGGNNVKYVDLPEDSASGMTQVCRLLHFCCDITQPGPEPDVLLEAARVVDKYFLQKSVSFAVDRWLKPDTEIYDPSELISGLGKMAIAADLFDHSQGFYRVTRAMLLSCGWGRSDYEYFPDSADAECRWRMICEY
ncbi:hypothetical protein PMZ80_009680 [Knufia obscura]|uniref:BTB domain-containing protein n=2 Tax=Knufia TaxID=430999 RepID=A0AAN8I605_9EURO|nr:hypothetical protein PMZ80_009680 [Knufia obscura]KAK5951036.1 hypothetical protein OHC33_007789 [Knufia fluminis]